MCRGRGFREQPRWDGCLSRGRLGRDSLCRLFKSHHPRVGREEDADVLLAHVAARDLDEPDLLQLHQVARQLPLVLPERGGLHPEMELDGAAGVGLLRQRRVGDLRAGADLLARQQPFAEVGVLFGPSKRWRSATPFSLPRFATRGAGKPARPRDMPETQLVRELRLRGLPEPVSVTPVGGYSTGGRPLVRWPEFETRRFKGETGHGLAGFDVEFAGEIAGPLGLGFACHFGLGLFMPAD